MHEDTIYRCVNPACARLMPRPVKFCPWCGTAQATGRAPAHADGGGAAAAAAAVQAAGAGQQASRRADWSDAPASSTPAPTPRQTEPAAAGLAAPARETARDAAINAAAATAAGTAAARAGLAGARASTRADTHAGADASTSESASASAGTGTGARGPRLGTLFGHGARATAQQPSPPADSVPRPHIPPRPAKPQRHPIRLRWWILVLLALWAVWLVARPNSSRQIERRIDHAAALAKDCKAREAQDELIALRKSRATPAQLERLQDALNDGAAACTRKRQRDKAWTEASSAAESALGEGNAERAAARLQAFTRRWGDDERSRALRSRIDDARHPLAAPEG